MTNVPRILIVTPGGSIFTDPFVRAFTKLGYECVVFDSRQGFVFTSSIVRKVLHALPALKFLKRYRVQKTNQALLALVRQFHPRYLLSQKAESIYPDTIEAIRGQGVVTMNFYNDFINLWENIKRVAPAYDFFFSPDHVVLRELERNGIWNGKYLPVAVEVRDDNPKMEGQHRPYDISFVGTHNNSVYSKRERYLSAVSNLGLHIWGSEGWTATKLASNFHGRAQGDERFDIYRKSKIVIDVNFDAWPCEAISMRPFEVGSSGACLFSDTIRADLSRVFEPSIDFVPFSDEFDLRKKVEYYLQHNAERIAIAQSCYKKVLARHTYDIRVRQILDIAATAL
jgi:spore maturation protein CgeB